MKTLLVSLHTLTELHCGIGQGIGAVDRPTARDHVTGYPLIPGSSIKGVLRAEMPQDTAAHLAAFGPDRNAAGEAQTASSAAFTDALLIGLPVASFWGTFALITAPLALRRLKQQAELIGWNLPDIPELHEFDGALCTPDSCLTNKQTKHPLVVLGECVLKAQATDPLAEKWAKVIEHLQRLNSKQAGSPGHFLIVSDDVFAHFCRTGLPVRTHNALGENGVVLDGALWQEESVPTGTVFTHLIHIEPDRKRRLTEDELGQYLAENLPSLLQLGARATTGKGLVSVRHISSMEAS